MDASDAARRSGETKPTPPGAVHVRYWAAARAAAGVPGDDVPVTGPTTLADLVERVRALHPDDRFARVVGVCSALVGDEPVGRRDPRDVVVPPGAVVELLPPFAGG